MGPKNKGEGVKLVCMMVIVGREVQKGRSTETWEVS